jgi:hypothetical protein
MKKEHLAHFDIAGFTYYDGAIAFRKLKIGKKVRLQLEEENKFDARAVVIYYNEFKLGFVPRSENRILYKLLKTGLDQNLSVVIQRLDPTAYPENQVSVIVHLVNDIV